MATSEFREAEQYSRERVLRYLREWLVNKVRYGDVPVTADVMLARLDLMLAGVESDRARSAPGPEVCLECGGDVVYCQM